jgi:hypothetical protein
MAGEELLWGSTLKGAFMVDMNKIPYLFHAGHLFLASVGAP